MSKGHAVVVGGGIGGLAAAAGLYRTGWRVTVFERAAEFAEIGTEISLMSNALRALEALGFGAEVADMPRTSGTGTLRASTGRVLNRFDPQHPVSPEFAMVHRAKLHRMLRDALPAESLRHSSNVTGVTGVTGETTVDGKVAVAVGGSTLDADLVVAADGVGSALRAQLFPGHPGAVYSGATAWRAITETPAGLDPSITLGPGSEFGVVPLPGGQVYWFCSLVRPPHERYTDERAAVHSFFGDWPARIGELITATPSEAILHHDLAHLATPLPSFVSGRTVLLGDAAHAMVPHLGQGGAQALEDAVELTAALAASPVPDALAAYDQRRRPRAQKVARASARTGQLIRLRNPFAVAVRDTVIRLLPPSVSGPQSGRLLDWTPPRVDGPADRTVQ